MEKGTRNETTTIISLPKLTQLTLSFLFTHSFLALRNLSPHSTVTNLHIFLCLSYSFSQWLADVCPTPIDVSCNCGEVKMFLSIVRKVTVYDLENPALFGPPNWILLGPRREFFKPHRTGMDGICRYGHKNGQIPLQSVVEISRPWSHLSY